jgi:dihydroneopterin aldolase
MKIHIRDLTAHTIIGVHAWEQEAPRPLILNITLTLENDKAGKSDALHDTVDYDSLTQDILLMLKDRRYQLIEAVAQDILTQLLAQEMVCHASVTVDKPGAIAGARSVAVSVEGGSK